MPRKKTVPEQLAEQATLPLGEEMNSGTGEDAGIEAADPQELEVPGLEEESPANGPPGISYQENGIADVPGAGLSGEDGPRDETADQAFDALLQDWIESGPATAENSAEPLTLDTAPDDGSSVPTEHEAQVAEGAPMETEGVPFPAANASPYRRRASPRNTAESRGMERERVLTITAREVLQTDEDRRAAIWHEIQNADWTRRILTGTLDSVERTVSGNTVAVVNYRGFRVVIPLKEMLLYPEPYPTGPEYTELMDRQRRILMTRLNSEIDFVIKGHDNKERCAVGSRKDAMYRKRQTFYLNKNELGESLIYEGRVVQARVVSVAEKMIRVEVFGVECPIVARGLSRSWIGDAGEKYHVGDTILVRIRKITGDTVQNLSVTVDVRSVFQDDEENALKKCVVQGRYAGRITDVRSGMVFIHLNNGANAIAHACYDRRTPGKGDDISFAVTRLDEEHGVAVGIITRIIKQNL